MIFGVMVISETEEKKRIRQCFSDLTAYYTDEKMEIREVRAGAQLLAMLKETDLLDMAVIDVTLPGALEGAREVRRRFVNTEILVIADVSISPMEYMHPSIRASALLLRPPARIWENALRDFFTPLLVKNEKENEGDILWVENRDGVFRIPFGQICYLEAREKKVFVRTRTEEFGVNGTIEKFSGELPKNFIRCHRSFIVNMDYVYKIKLTENMLYLRDDMFVPVSRSYKAELKEAFK